MQKGLKLDGQMRGLALSLGGGAVMAIVAMLIPVSVFESITGATGISELVPATAAPLGDTARAMIAFLFAAGAFAGLAAIFLRQPVRHETVQPTPVTVGADAMAEPVQLKPSAFDQIRKTVTDWVASRRAGPVVTELSDLPKLRAGDAHPDAPPRRPISAHRDFGEIEDTPAMPLSQAQQAHETPPAAVPALNIADDVTETLIDHAPEPISASALPMMESPAAAIADPAHDEASVHALVNQLEAAVARRQMQLERLEKLALSEQSVSVPEPINPVNIGEDAPKDDATAPPVLEVVPSTVQESGTGEEMDDALRSALETLQRMNMRSR